MVKKGSILDLLKFDINKILVQTEEHRKIEMQNNQIKFIDYHYQLDEKELNVFNHLILRLFSQGKYFNPQIHTHIKLIASDFYKTSEYIETIEALIDLYGEDDNGAEKILLEETAMLDKRDYWHGRTWNFNQKHKLWKINHPEKDFIYSVTIHYDSLEQGFSLSIFGYNRLVELFGAK